MIQTQAADLFGAEGLFLLLAVLIDRAELSSSADSLKRRPRPPHLTLLSSVAKKLWQQRPAEFAERLVHALTETVAAPTPGLSSDLSEALALSFVAQLDLSLTLAQYTTGVWQEEGASPRSPIPLIESITHQNYIYRHHTHVPQHQKTKVSPFSNPLSFAIHESAVQVLSRR